MRDCVGYGLVASTHGGPTNDVVVRGVRAERCNDGFAFVGAHLRVQAVGCVSTKNRRHGFAAGLSSTSVLESCTSSHNGESGFNITSPTTRMTNCSTTQEREGFAVSADVRDQVRATDCRVNDEEWAI